MTYIIKYTLTFYRIEREIKMPNLYIVYILRCEGNKLYTGYTNDLEARFEKHKAGQGAKFTRSFKPLEIAVYWDIKSKNKSIPLKMKQLLKI